MMRSRDPSVTLGAGTMLPHHFEETKSLPVGAVLRLQPVGMRHRREAAVAPVVVTKRALYLGAVCVDESHKAWIWMIDRHRSCICLHASLRMQAGAIHGTMQTHPRLCHRLLIGLTRLLLPQSSSQSRSGAK